MKRLTSLVHYIDITNFFFYNYLMKKFLLILILALSFQSWTNADNVKDFQIEGISVGDSLLNHFSKREINERVKITKSRYKDKSIVRAYFKLNKYDLYPILNIHFKDDNKLTLSQLVVSNSIIEKILKLVTKNKKNLQLI